MQGAQKSATSTVSKSVMKTSVDQKCLASATSNQSVSGLDIKLGKCCTLDMSQESQVIAECDMSSAIQEVSQQFSKMSTSQKNAMSGALGVSESEINSETDMEMHINQRCDPHAASNQEYKNTKIYVEDCCDNPPDQRANKVTQSNNIQANCLSKLAAEVDAKTQTDNTSKQESSNLIADIVGAYMGSKRPPNGAPQALQIAFGAILAPRGRPTGLPRKKVIVFRQNVQKTL